MIQRLIINALKSCDRVNRNSTLRVLEVTDGLGQSGYYIQKRMLFGLYWQRAIKNGLFLYYLSKQQALQFVHNHRVEKARYKLSKKVKKVVG